MTIRIVPYKKARLEHFKAVREKRKKTLHWWKYQKPGKQYGQQMIWKMCDDLGDEIGYLDDVIAMLGVQGCWYCNDDVMQVVDSPNKPPIHATYCGLCGRKLEGRQ